MKNLQEIKKLSFELNDIMDIIYDVTGKRINMRSDYKVIHDRLFEDWYSTFDHKVYSDTDYIFVPLDCFKGWTRNNVINTIKYFHKISVAPKSILDLFGGTGQSTILLALAFPESEVYYFNSDSTQNKVFEKLVEKYKVLNIKIVNDLTLVKPECVVAYEAIEHIQDPTSFMVNLLKDVTYYVDASSFTLDSIGHYPFYLDGQKQIANKDYKRFYFKWLNSIGFNNSFSKQLKDTKFYHDRFYNGRPNVFVRH